MLVCNSEFSMSYESLIIHSSDSFRMLIHSGIIQVTVFINESLTN